MEEKVIEVEFEESYEKNKRSLIGVFVNCFVFTFSLIGFTWYFLELGIDGFVSGSLVDTIVGFVVAVVIAAMRTYIEKLKSERNIYL